MNREEILAKSKRENHGQDFANLEAAKESMQFGWVVIVCLLAAVTVVDALVFERMNSEVFFALTAVSSAVFFIKYRKLLQKHELILAVMEAAAAAAFLIVWILQLVKH